MLHFYVRLCTTLTLLFTLVSITLIALGSTQPIHPALRGFVEGCEGIPQPCWYGIVPGVTMMEDARSILQNLGYEQSHENGLYLSIPSPKMKGCRAFEVE